MAIEVKLPNLGDGIDTGDVLELLVKEGDTIAKDQGIVELETGKATLQVPSSAAGKILKVHIKPGQTIPVGATLLTLESSTADVASAPTKPAPQPAKAPAPKPASAPAPQPAATAPAPK